MISFLINAFKIIFLLGFLIFIHELGHFLVAKFCKVKVNEFAIGFGPTIWKKQGKETKYAIRLIPLGGFVNMLGEEERSNEEGSFNKSSISKRIAIVIAGGLVNIIFGLITYFILMLSSASYYSTTIDNVYDGYAALESGICSNDEILEINGEKVRFVSDINDNILKYNGEEVTLKIKRDNEIKYINLKPTKEITKSIGIYLGANEENELTSEIKSLLSGSPAELAGLEEGDIILKINDEEVYNNPNTVVELINNTITDKVLVEIDRNNEILEFNITPTITDNYKIGVSFKVAENNFRNKIYYCFWDTIDFSISIVENVKELFTGKVSTNQLMGPVGISETISKTQGVIEFVYLLAIISLSLGVTNLLPFPPLDGWKIVTLIIEAIRRKPLDEKTEASIQLVGFAMLIALSLYVTYNDILRIF